MVESISQKVIGRMAAVLGVALGAMVAADAFMPAERQISRTAQVGIALAGVTLGVW